ncbi:MAG TPA: DUF4952 domain-containing protein [Nostocaceae cyanobacterium]|nr:DUF4952 domain-containing protein [Nostocaceae cyanobacterium]
MKKLLSVSIGITILAVSAGFNLIAHSLVSNANQEVELKAKISCKDFLLEMGSKPKELEFLECKNTESFGLDALEASYRVSGKDAAKIEGFLQQKFKMSKLKFLCCGWEPVFVTENGANSSGKAYYTDKFGHRYEITMHSGETLVNERQDWQKIPFFYVKVVALLEAP